MNENPDNEPRMNYWRDTADCWHRLPNKALFFVLLAAWLALFQFLGNAILGYIHTPSLFSWLKEQYDNRAADDSHGNFIPFLVIGLFWWKRRELLAQPLKLWWPGLLILTGAMLLHIFGYLVQQPYFSIAALFAGVLGLMGLAWGPGWLRHSRFPFFLFVFSVPLGQRGEVITFPLQQLVCWLTEKSAHIIGIDVIRVGTALFNPSGTYQYQVAAACSGIRSLVAIFLLATIYGFFVFRSPGKRLLLMALALPFSVLGNLARMMCIIIAAELGGQKAGNYVHEGCPIHVPLVSDVFGDIAIVSLVPYLPAMVGLLLVGRWLENRELNRTST